MTLEQLVLIVMQAVERAIKLSRLKITAFAFEKANAGDVLDVAKVINGSALTLTSEMQDCGDVLFLDCIPIEYLPKLALGICDEPVCRQIIKAVANGKTVFVLKKSPDDMQNAPAACRALIDTYRRFLGLSGFVFLDSDAHSDVYRSARINYSGNVFSRGDLMNHSGDGVKEIVVSPDCAVTTLAADTARSMNITIRKQIL